MHRRHLIAAGALLSLRPAWAHHGWSSFDQSRPIYLEGRAASVAWRNPHAELVLELAEDLRLPADLTGRPLPARARSGARSRPNSASRISIPGFSTGRWACGRLMTGAA